MSGPERNKVVAGAEDALAVARGEKPAGAIWENGHRYVPADELAASQAEIQTLTTAGIAEVAARNPSVMDYMAHWEGRAEKAEAENARLREALDLRKWIAECPVAPNADAPKEIWANPSPNDHTNPATSDWTEGDWSATANSLAEKYVRADQATRLQAQVEALKGALRTLRSYAKWQMTEGTDHHPTLPSAIAEADRTLATHDSNCHPAGVDRTQEDRTDG